jgi:hypothetical protein
MKGGDSVKVVVEDPCRCFDTEPEDYPGSIDENLDWAVEVVSLEQLYELVDAMPGNYLTAGFDCHAPLGKTRYFVLHPLDEGE